MKEDRIYRIIGRHVSGKSTHLEAQELKTWLAEDEHHQIILQAFQEYWNAENVNSNNQEKVLARIYERMDKAPKPASPARNISLTGNKYFPKFLYRVAAVLIVGTLLSWVAVRNITHIYDDPDQIVMVEKIVPYGQKSTIKLSDGSIVKLNAGSKLRYPSQFSGPSRKVYLEGEAFFEIQENTSLPFLVTSGDIVTTVLGTSFNVKAHAEENMIKVALVTGKVKVSHKSLDKSQFDYTLVPNEMFTYHKEAGRSEKGYFDPSEALAWKNQTLFFENANLNEMTAVLQRWYGKKFIINNGDAIITRKFSGKFENNRSLEYVLDVLSLNSNFSYQITGDTVIIQGKP